MDPVLVLKVIILGIVEGLTEFLPVSSTGHLILVGHVLNFNDERGKVFEIFIQTGAIFAVCVEYRQRLLATLKGLPSDPIAQRFALNLLIAFIPLASLGFLFNKQIKMFLFKPIPVALAFIIGGVIILAAERWYKKRCAARINSTALPLIDSIDVLRWQDALKLGLAQCAALIPGTSRSGATIIGGLYFGLSRKCATEFSFFLAIPTLFAATIYSIWKARELLTTTDVPLFSIGFIAAFVSAYIVIRWLIRYVSTHDFTIFAWYRIVFGLIILLMAYTDTVNWTAD